MDHRAASRRSWAVEGTAKTAQTIDDRCRHRRSTLRQNARPRGFPVLLLMTGMLGALFPALNATTTERELGTLETLLVTPAGRMELLIAKGAASHPAQFPADGRPEHVEHVARAVARIVDGKRIGLPENQHGGTSTVLPRGCSDVDHICHAGSHRRSAGSKFP